MAEIARLVWKGSVQAVQSYQDGILQVEKQPVALTSLVGCVVLTDYAPLVKAIDALPQVNTITVLPLAPEKMIPQAPDNDAPTFTLSYSAISTFKTCPRQFQHLYVLKDVERTTGEAALWGVEIHKQLEDFLNDGKPLVDDMAKREESYIAGVRRKFAIRLEKVEFQWALDMDWQLVGFRDPLARLRGVIDWLVVSGTQAVITDHKTGKRKPDDFAQMDIFALAVCCIYPQVQSIRGVYYWLKQGDTPTYRDYTRDEMDTLKESVTQDMAQIDETDEIGIWPMRPSGLCRGWCAAKQCPAYRERT